MEKVEANRRREKAWANLTGASAGKIFPTANVVYLFARLCVNKLFYPLAGPYFVVAGEADYLV